MERKNGLPPVHPGEIIKEDILPSVGLSLTAAAKALGVSRQMLHGIPAGRTPLSAIMCLKVARLFWRLAGSMDAIAGRLRSEKIRAKLESHGSRRADRASQARRRSSGLSPNVSETC